MTIVVISRQRVKLWINHVHCIYSLLYYSQECLDFVKPSLTHALDLLQDRKQQVQSTHVEVQHHVHQQSGEILQQHKPAAPQQPIMSHEDIHPGRVRNISV